jgi:hypothetical protein
MSRRIALVALALGAALWTLGASSAEAKFFRGKQHGNACEAYAGNDTGPTDCGGCGGCGCQEDTCCKPKRKTRCHKPKCCDPCADACPKACEPECKPCGDCCDPCCRPRPLHDLFAALRKCCDDLCGCETSCGCGAPAPSCGCGH